MPHARGRMRRECRFFLALVRTARYPHGSAGGVPASEVAPGIDRGRRDPQIELDVAGDMDALCRGADRKKPLGIDPALCADHHVACERFPDQRIHASITIYRSDGEPRAANDERHVAPAELAVERRPDLSLENDRQPGLHAVEKPPHRPRCVERQVTVVDAVAEERAGALCARRGHGGERDREVGMTDAQRA